MESTTGGPVIQEGAVDVHRMPVEWSAYYAVQEPENGVAKNTALLIAIHGYGQSCKGFIKNFARLRSESCLVVAPQAPNQFYWERGKVGFGWVTRFQKEQTLADELCYLGKLVDAIRERYAIDESRVFLCGFSQGTVMAYRVAAAGFVRPAGLIACSSDLPADVEAKLDSIPPCPVLIVHGKADKRPDTEKARKAEAALKKHGFDVETAYFDGGHELPEAQVDRIVHWMRANGLGETAPSERR